MTDTAENTGFSREEFLCKTCFHVFANLEIIKRVCNVLISHFVIILHKTIREDFILEENIFYMFRELFKIYKIFFVTIQRLL